MANFRVKWEIDIEDETNPLEAAKKALELMRGHDSTAVVFTMQDKNTKECFSVDLDEPEGEEVLPLTESQFKE